MNRTTFAILSTAALLGIAHYSCVSSRAQCSSPPISDSRLLTGTVHIDLGDVSSIPTVPGVTSFSDQLNNAVRDLNSVLSQNQINYTFANDNGNSGTILFIDVDPQGVLDRQR